MNFFSLDSIFNRSLHWPADAAPVFMLDRPLVRYGAERTCSEEISTLAILLRVFRNVCTKRAAFFVDSGANEGTWSLLAAAHGCNAIAIEPQPLCASTISAAAQRSGLANNLHILKRVFVDDRSSKSPCVPVDMCRGTATYDRGTVKDIYLHSKANAQLTHSRECSTVTNMQLDDLISGGGATGGVGGASDSGMGGLHGGTIELWHLDVEVPIRYGRRT